MLCVLCCVFDCERVWGLAAAALVEGSDDPGGGAESKSTGFGSFRTGRLVGVSVSRAGPLLRVYATTLLTRVITLLVTRLDETKKRSRRRMCVLKCV